MYHKYRAKAQVCAKGHKHPSRREAARCAELVLLEKSGKIIGLEYEPKFPFVIDGREVRGEPDSLGRRGKVLGYRPDFTYIENGVKVAEDVKSKATVTTDFVLRASFFRHLYPSIELRIIT